MSYDGAIQILKAAADPTRFRLLNLLRGGEATVGELQAVLRQSQPRVSRHLRLLGEAGLVEQFRDGQWKYYRLDDDGDKAGQIGSLLQLAGDDPAIERDRRALELLKRRRENEALRPTASIGWLGRRPSAHRPHAAELAETMAELLGDARFASALLVGCGGVVLDGVAQYAQRVVAVDESKSARLIARSRAHQSGFRHLTVRNARPDSIPYPDKGFELVFLNEILNGASPQREMLVEAIRVLDDTGRLLVFDRIRPAARRLSRGAELVENQLGGWLAELGCRIIARHWFAGRELEYALFVATKNFAG